MSVPWTRTFARTACVKTSEEATAASVTSVMSLTQVEKTVLVSESGIFLCT